MNGLPDYFKVHTKISMDNYISRANNIIHGVSIYRSCIDLKMFFAASPIISSARITAKVFLHFCRMFQNPAGSARFVSMDAIMIRFLSIRPFQSE